MDVVVGGERATLRTCAVGLDGDLHVMHRCDQGARRCLDCDALIFDVFDAGKTVDPIFAGGKLFMSTGSAFSRPHILLGDANAEVLTTEDVVQDTTAISMEELFGFGSQHVGVAIEEDEVIVHPKWFKYHGAWLDCLHGAFLSSDDPLGSAFAMFREARICDVATLWSMLSVHLAIQVDCGKAFDGREFPIALNTMVCLGMDGVLNTRDRTTHCRAARSQARFEDGAVVVTAEVTLESLWSVFGNVNMLKLPISTDISVVRIMKDGCDRAARVKTKDKLSVKGTGRSAKVRAEQKGYLQVMLQGSELVVMLHGYCGTGVRSVCGTAAFATPCGSAGNLQKAVCLGRMLYRARELLSTGELVRKGK